MMISTTTTTTGAKKSYSNNASFVFRQSRHCSGSFFYRRASVWCNTNSRRPLKSSVCYKAFSKVVFFRQSALRGTVLVLASRRRRRRLLLLLLLLLLALLLFSTPTRSSSFLSSSSASSKSCGLFFHPFGKKMNTHF